ncbi:complex I subunit 4 family protein [Candidatus Nitrosocosmicus agrestis]|jgi:NADH-quinone oxidoreductase subunit M|uniref:complex I subunit 4 family protein n=1 Tax=Candidatus Nitrosocosmicus agrestis TaxID=2563600 RepID=UPI00122DF74A|nr:NADH-quinone oxidoreductase subunit M [Candidatus Nitrosocosmicus sp. SS]KAA2279746.1 NADH-quinone oxidoreductase subunit M [Candidatus Nitrosocosmicus sp. SS]KAF0868818.1 NADH-quinone oxidoreductase subunit M [Candidatus Nitrosocosmicus sp. SS]
MVDSSYYLMVATFMPLILSPVVYFLGKRKGINITTWLTFGILAISTILVIIPSIGLGSGGNYQEIFDWSQLGHFGLKLDGLSIPFAITIYLLSTIIVIYSKPYMVRKILIQFDQVKNSLGNKSQFDDVENESYSATDGKSLSTLVLNADQKNYLNEQLALYYTLYLVFAMGMLGTVLATNLFEFYVFFELMLVPSFFLIAFFGYGNRKRTSIMFFFWAHVGAVVMLLGLMAMGFLSGGFDYDVVKANVSQIPPAWIAVIVASLIIGFGVKLAAFLVHVWLPDSYTDAPTPITVLISSVMTGIGAYGLIRLWIELLSGPGNYTDYSIYVNIWGLATMIYGGAMALMQKDIKRVLAYSSISSMGYLLFGIGSESVLGISGAIFMFVTHALGKGILFMMAGSIILQTGTRNMDKLGGLGGKMPYTAVFAMIGGLTIIGVPITSGFMSEWVLFNGALQNAVVDWSSLKAISFALAITATILTSAYILWMYKRIFYGVVPETLKNIRDSSMYILVTMGILASLTLVLGLYPDLFYKPIIGYVESLYDHSPSEIIPVKIKAGTGQEPVGQAGVSPDQGQSTSNVTNVSYFGSAQKTHLISGNQLVSFVTI